MKRLSIVAALALLACAPSQPQAERLARDWANGIGLRVDAVRCDFCAGVYCRCDVRSGDSVTPLSCSSDGCWVRRR